MRQHSFLCHIQTAVNNSQHLVREFYKASGKGPWLTRAALSDLFHFSLPMGPKSGEFGLWHMLMLMRYCSPDWLTCSCSLDHDGRVIVYLYQPLYVYHDCAWYLPQFNKLFVAHVKYVCSMALAFSIYWLGILNITLEKWCLATCCLGACTLSCMGMRTDDHENDSSCMESPIFTYLTPLLTNPEPARPLSD